MRSGWRVRGRRTRPIGWRGRVVEGQDGNVGHSLGRGGGHQRGAATEAGEPDDGVGPAELERHGAVNPGPGESRVDLEAESRLAAHLDEPAGRGELVERDAGAAGQGVPAGDDGDQRFVGEQVVDDAGRNLLGYRRRFEASQLRRIQR